jgi:hypothetical protein
MALPLHDWDHVDIVTDPPSSTGWTLISSGGGGANSFSVPEVDDFIQTASLGVYGAISRNPFSSSIRGMVYNSSQTIPSGSAIFIWAKCDAAQAIDEIGNGGIQVLIGSGTGALKCYYVDGFRSYRFGGWKCYVVDPTVTPSTTIGSPTSTTAYFGIRWNVPSSGPTKGYPFKIDAIRYGSYVRGVDGDSSTPMTFQSFNDITSYSDTVGLSRFYGCITKKGGTFEMQGGCYIGSSATSGYFEDSNQSVVILDTLFVGSGFNNFTIRNNSTTVKMTNISIKALGTVSKGDWITYSGDDPTVELTSCIFSDMGVFGFSSNAVITGCQFLKCGIITQNGATFNGNNQFVSVAFTDILHCDDVDLISDSSFQHTTSTTGHAITLDANHAGGSYTLSNVTFSGYSGTPGSNLSSSSGSTNAMIYNNSGGAVTLYIVDGGTEPSIRNGAGATTTVIVNPVTVTLTVTDVDGSPIEDANTFVQASSGGPYPANASVTISNSGTTATVTHSSHNLETGDKVCIRGASHYQNNGVFTITKTGTSSYTYTMGSAPGSSPTGTITSTFTLLYGLTDINGQISMSRVISSSQPVNGWARKSSSAPYFKQGGTAGSVSSTSGVQLSAILIADE